VITLQAALGIVTLLHQAPLALALLHQGMAMVVLTIAVVHAQGFAPIFQPARVSLANDIAIRDRAMRGQAMRDQEQPT
jgi:hypothetical protein